MTPEGKVVGLSVNGVSVPNFEPFTVTANDKITLSVRVQDEIFVFSADVYEETVGQWLWKKLTFWRYRS